MRETLTTTSSDNFATLVKALTLYADETWTGTIVGQDYTIELIKGRINQIGFTAATTREQVEAAIAGTSGQFMVSFGSTSMMARNGKLVDIQIATITHQPLSIPSGENVPNNSRPQGCDAIAPVGTPDLFQVDRRGDKATLYFTPVRDFTDRYHVVFGHADGDERYGGIAMSVSAEQNNGVLAININNLDPSQTYAFKVAPVNNCAVGTWSNWLTTKGVSRAGSSVSKTYRYGGSTISVSNNVISKPRTSTPVNTQPLLEAGSVNPTPIKTVSRQPKHLTF